MQVKEKIIKVFSGPRQAQPFGPRTRANKNWINSDRVVQGPSGSSISDATCIMQVSKSTLTRNIFFIFSLFDSSRIHFPPTQIFLCFHQNYEKKLLKKCLIFEKCRFQVDRFMFIISEINDWRTKRTKTIPNWLKGIHFSFIKPTEEIKIEL